jgi:hypothetical protein
MIKQESEKLRHVNAYNPTKLTVPAGRASLDIPGWPSVKGHRWQPMDQAYRYIAANLGPNFLSNCCKSSFIMEPVLNRTPFVSVSSLNLT